MNTIEDKMLSKDQTRRIFAVASSLLAPMSNQMVHLSRGFSPVDFIVFIFKEVFAIDVSKSLRHLSTLQSDLKLEEIATGDIVLVAEDDASTELIPALVLGPIARQIVYFSPHFKFVVEAEFDPSGNGIVYHGSQKINYRAIKTVGINRLLSIAS